MFWLFSMQAGVQKYGRIVNKSPFYAIACNRHEATRRLYQRWFLFVDGELQYLHTPEGRVVVDGNGYS